jgi:hypothetical protein
MDELVGSEQDTSIQPRIVSPLLSSGGLAGFCTLTVNKMESGGADKGARHLPGGFSC